MAQRLCAITALITVLYLAICLVGGFASPESPADGGALRQLLQSSAVAPTGPLSSIATKTTIDFMMYFMSSVPSPVSGSVILSFPDDVTRSSGPVNVTYTELRLYTGQASDVTGWHVHKLGPVFYQLTFPAGLGSGSLVVDSRDVLSMLGKPDDFYMDVHSAKIDNPLSPWASGPFPKLVTVVTLKPMDNLGSQVLQGQAMVELSFHEGAICAHNIQFTGVSPPASIEVDITEGTETVPSIEISFPVGTTGHCVPLDPGQMEAITSNMQKYGVRVSVSSDGQSFFGRLDNSVRQVALTSAGEPGPPVKNGGVGLVRLDALTPRSLCYWQLQMSPGVTMLELHLHEGGPTEVGRKLVSFYPIAGASITSVPSLGCVTNVSADVISAYVADLPNTYINVHNVDNPDGVMRGQLAPFGQVPADLPTPDQLRPTTSASKSSVVLVAAAASVGTVALLVALCAALFLYRRRYKRRSAEYLQRQDAVSAKLEGSAWLHSGGTSPYSGFRPSSVDSAPPSTLAFSGGQRSENGQTSWVEQESASTFSGQSRASKRSSYRNDTSSAPSSLDVDVSSVARLSVKDIMEATNHFHPESVIGGGGFGVVYRGRLADGTAVAVKRASKGALRSSREFRTEVKLLSRLHHQNLVELVAYCLETDEQALVYRYLPNGSFRDWLSRSSDVARPRLSWLTRLEICLGTANGLNYLHTGASPRVIHRDVKSSNVLLDGDFCAKVSDFGFGWVAAMPEFGGTSRYQSTAVCGTPGYLDPEFFETANVTDKSDVYALGVMLLEILTGKAAVEIGSNGQQANLARLMRPLLERPELYKAQLEPLISEQGSQESIAAVAALAAGCTAVTGKERPTMAEVASVLQGVVLSERQQYRGTPRGVAPGTFTPGREQHDSSGGMLNDSVFLGR